MRKLIIITLFLITVSAFAQDNPTPPPISADNYQNLQSVGQIDFEAYRNRGQYEVYEFERGWFAVDNEAIAVAVVDTRNQIYVWRIDERALREEHVLTFVSSLPELPPLPGVASFGLYYDKNYQAPDVVHTLEIADIRFLDFNTLIAIHYTDDRTRIVNHVLYLGQTETAIFPYDDAKPISIWVDSEDENYLWFEVLPDDPSEESYVLRMWTYYHYDPDKYLLRLPYAPAQDPDAIVRIGRIHPPYVVTSSIDGIVKLWHLQSGRAIYEVDNGTGQAAVFGNINNAATHLVWRDHGSNALYLLNFETGENRFIDELEGGYVQWFFLTNDASLIIAVNYNFEPNIVVWDVETGERTVLGEYRHCERPQPDMARLSADGTTLVIGCDTGLDIWRVVTNG